MIRVIQPGETGVDFAWGHPPPARLVELGYSFVVGYLGPDPKSGKLLLNPLDYINAGMGVNYVFEASATSPNNGRWLGLQHGASAKKQVIALGHPLEVPVLVAYDTDTNATNIEAHKAYHAAFAETFAPYNSAAAYDDTTLAAVLHNEIDWLPLAWSWSGTSRADAEAKARALGYEVLQGKGFYIDGVWAVDPNVCISPFKSWGIPKDVPADTLVKDEDMKPVFLTVTGLPGQYLWVPGHAPFPFTNPADRDALLAGLGIDPASGQTISQEMYARLFPAPVQVTVPPITVPAAVVNVPPFKFPTFTVTAV